MRVLPVSLAAHHTLGVPLRGRAFVLRIEPPEASRPCGLQSLTPSRRAGAARCACLPGDCFAIPRRAALGAPRTAGQGGCPDRLVAPRPAGGCSGDHGAARSGTLACSGKRGVTGLRTPSARRPRRRDCLRVAGRAGFWSARPAAPGAGPLPPPTPPSAPQGGSPLLSAWVSVPLVRSGAVAGLSVPSGPGHSLAKLARCPGPAVTVGQRHPLRYGGRAWRTGSPVAARPTPARQARPCVVPAPCLWSALRASPFAGGPVRPGGRPGRWPPPTHPSAPQGGSHFFLGSPG